MRFAATMISAFGLAAMVALQGCGGGGDFSCTHSVSKGTETMKLGCNVDSSCCDFIKECYMTDPPSDCETKDSSSCPDDVRQPSEGMLPNECKCLSSSGFPADKEPAFCPAPSPSPSPHGPTCLLKKQNLGGYWITVTVYDLDEDKCNDYQDALSFCYVEVQGKHAEIEMTSELGDDCSGEPCDVTSGEWQDTEICGIKLIWRGEPVGCCSYMQTGEGDRPENCPMLGINNQPSCRKGAGTIESSSTESNMHMVAKNVSTKEMPHVSTRTVTV